MITRYSVNMEDRLIEPAEHGKWVKYEDCANIETMAREKAEKAVSQEHQRDNETLADQAEQISLLTAALTLLETDSKKTHQDQEATIHRQRFLLKTAKDRLKLLGHSANCFSRYGAITVGGSETINDCNCGLDEWVKESGIG